MPTTSPRPARRRLATLLAAVALTIPALALDSHPAHASSAPDLFADTFGDAMDFSNPEDVAITPNTTLGMSNASISGGQFHAELGAPSWLALLWPGFPGALPHGREGAAQPVDASRYSRLVLRMNAPAGLPMIVLWHTCAAANESCQGGTLVTTQAGFQTYDIGLRATASDAGLSKPWSGSIYGLRLLFPTGSGHLDVDWARVVPADAANVGEIGDNVAPSFDDRFDYATQSGNAWDFTSAGDVLSVGGVSSSSVGSGTVAACNKPTNASTGDPNVVLALPGGPINANVYHRIAISYRFQGAFSLSPGQGGGSLMRVVWVDAAGKRHVSQDLVTYPGQQIITVDLRTNPPGAVSEDGSSWSGSIRELRIDPNEDAGGRCWNIDRVWLLADTNGAVPPAPTPVAAGQPAPVGTVPAATVAKTAVAKKTVAKKAVKTTKKKVVATRKTVKKR